MVCQDEYETALAEGSASEETLEGMRQNIMAIEDAIRNLPAPDEERTELIVYEPAEKGYKDWNDQLLGKRMEPEENELADMEISGRATMNRALASLPEINPEHIRSGRYDEADRDAVQKRLERADRVIFSFELNDQGMPEKGFLEMYQIREELARMEKDIDHSLSGMKEESRPHFHR